MLTKIWMSWYVLDFIKVFFPTLTRVLLLQELEYGRYLQEVVKTLDEDPEFSKKLENITHEQIMVRYLGFFHALKFSKSFKIIPEWSRGPTNCIRGARRPHQIG